MTPKLSQTISSFVAAIANAGDAGPQFGAQSKSGEPEAFDAIFTKTSLDPLVPEREAADEAILERMDVTSLDLGNLSPSIAELAQIVTGFAIAQSSEDLTGSNVKGSVEDRDLADPVIPPQAPEGDVVAPSIFLGPAEMTPARSESSQAMRETSPAPIEISVVLGDEGAVQANATPSKASASTIDDAPIVDNVPSTLRVTMIETHLPVAVAHAVTTMAEASGVSSEATTARIQTSLPMQRESTQVRILRFELEPESLGGIAVKMRLANTGVEISIDVQSTATLSRLNDLRERLSHVVAATGFTVETLDIRISPPLSLDMGQAQSHDGGASDSHGFQSQQQEFSDGEKSGERRQSPPRKSDLAPVVAENGRYGDRGDVYI